MLRIWTLRIWGFRGPGFRSARQVLCRDASRLFLDHFPKHLSTVLGVDRGLSPDSRAPKAPNRPQRKPPLGTVRIPTLRNFIFLGANFLALVIGRPAHAYGVVLLGGEVLGTFWNPLLRTHWVTFPEPFPEPFFYCNRHSKPASKNLSTLPQNPPRTFSEPFLEACVIVQPLMRAPDLGADFWEWDATTHVREKTGLSVKRGEAFSE